MNQKTNPGVWWHCCDRASAYCKIFSRAHYNTLNHAANSLSLQQRKPKTHQDYFQSPSLDTILSQFYPPSPHNIYLRSRSYRRMFRKRRTNKTVTWCETESGFDLNISQLAVKVSFLLYDHKPGDVFRKSRLQSDRHMSYLCLCLTHPLCNEYTREHRSKLLCSRLTPKARNYKRCASFTMYSGGLKNKGSSCNAKNLKQFCICEIWDWESQWHYSKKKKKKTCNISWNVFHKNANNARASVLDIQNGNMEINLKQC